MTEARLARMEAQLERCLTLLEAQDKKMDTRIHDSNQWRAEMSRTLNGVNGHTPGIVTRVDRLEQSSERSRWFIRALFVAVFGQLVSLIVRR